VTPFFSKLKSKRGLARLEEKQALLLTSMAETRKDSGPLLIVEG